MKRRYSMPEYYQLQGMLAKKHDIEDFHAGCHITYYQRNDMCTRCPRRDKCAEIYNKEKESGIYKSSDLG